MNQFELFLSKLADTLDVPEAMYEEAISRYKSVGEWLSREQSAVAAYEPDVYVQGSFRLGTPIRPLKSDEEYDIDLVCDLSRLTKAHLTQKQLKELVGEEINSYARKSGMNNKPENKRRCWTLQYADSAQFHLDILPAIPDANSMRILLESDGYQADRFTDYAVAITDDQHPHYSVRCDDWHSSNPKGYAEWFKSRMTLRFEERRKTIAESMQASVEDVPEHKVKTPLQRAVQILKRHRDMMFDGHDEHKPISIIISTLAAKAYNNEVSLAEAFKNIIYGMENHIEQREGKAWIVNPVNPLENFADKWEEESKKEQEFRGWLHQLETDYEHFMGVSDINSLREDLVKRFGKSAISEALPQTSLISKIRNSALTLLSPIAAVLSVSHRKDPQWSMAISRNVSISASFKDAQERSHDYVDDGSPIPPGVTIRFEAKTNSDTPFEVYWQVVNTGKSAEDDNCLRGDFYYKTAGRGGLIRFEPTKFRGKHWVECFIIQGGKCVARSGAFFVNIS